MVRGREGQNPQTFFIPERLPGLNEMLGLANKRQGRWNLYHGMKKQWESTIVHYIKAAHLIPMTSILLEIRWYEPDKRRDPDNIISAKKLILDCLILAGIIPGDGWKYVKAFHEEWMVAEKTVGVQVTLRPSCPECLEDECN